MPRFETLGDKIMGRIVDMPMFLYVPIMIPIVLGVQSLGIFLQLLRKFVKLEFLFGCDAGGRPGDKRVLRTPDERFEELDAYPFAPNYFEHDGMRLHYVAEGPAGAAETIVLLHGEPTWSYLYRKVIPLLVARGYRVVALDFLGMGKSDKPVDSARFSFANHVASVGALFEHLQLRQGATLVVHDWGGCIGQAALPSLGAATRRLVLLNTVAGPLLMGLKGHIFFNLWQGYVRVVGRSLPVDNLVAGGAAKGVRVPPAAAAGYAAPFPDADHKALAANWPLGYNRPLAMYRLYLSSMRWAREHFAAPVLVAFGTEDPLMCPARAQRVLRGWLQRAPAVERTDIAGASHFLQESQPAAVADAIHRFIGRFPATMCPPQHAA
jgi:haloalkane dehalogenase